MLKILSVFTFILLLYQAAAQNLISVHFEFPNNGEFEIRVDSNHVFKSKKFELAEGNYYVEIWVPGLKLLKDSIYVNPDSYNLYQFNKTEVIPEIKKNKTKRINYGVRKSIVYSTTVPTILLTYFTVRKFNNAVAIYDEMEVLRGQYSQSLNLNFLADSELKYSNLTASYERIRKEYRALVLMSAASFVCNTTLIYLFHRNFKKPKKYVDKSPFVKQPLKLSFAPNMTGLTLKLQI